MAADMKIARQYTASFYDEAAGGSFELNKVYFRAFLESARLQFPDSLKKRTLLVVSRNSPYYTQQLDPRVRARDEDAIRMTIKSLKQLGYDSIDYGSDFAVEDYGDRTHLTNSGGAKLASLLAPEISALAARLNYGQP